MSPLRTNVVIYEARNPLPPLLLLKGTQSLRHDTAEIGGAPFLQKTTQFFLKLSKPAVF